jgi:hypothetical protein
MIHKKETTPSSNRRSSHVIRRILWWVTFSKPTIIDPLVDSKMLILKDNFVNLCRLHMILFLKIEMFFCRLCIDLLIYGFFFKLINLLEMFFLSFIKCCVKASVPWGSNFYVGWKRGTLVSKNYVARIHDARKSK